MIGQRFRNKLTGLTVRVLAVETIRIQIFNTDTGNREWIDRTRFNALYRRCAVLNRLTA